MTIQEQIIQIISEHCEYGTDIISLKDSLEDDLGIDSLDKIELLLHLEDEFGINIGDEDVAEKINDVKDVMYWVIKLKGENNV